MTTISHTIAPVVFRLPLGMRLFNTFMIAMIGVAAVSLTAATVFLFLYRAPWELTALATACACLVSGLTRYAARDLAGKWRLRVVLEPQTLVLDLPPGRSLIHSPPEQHERIAYTDIAAIETRLEAYSKAGMGNMQRAYVLHRTNGQLIFLFEDRALGTPYETSFFPKLARDIAARAGVPLRDLGMDEGKLGILGVWGAHAPDWSSPALSAERQAKLWRAAARTMALPVPIFTLALLYRLWSG